MIAIFNAKVEMERENCISKMTLYLSVNRNALTMIMKYLHAKKKNDPEPILRPEECIFATLDYIGPVKYRRIS